MSAQKFVSCKRGNDNEVNKWYQHCQKEKIPYIVVEPRTKYSDVRFDYIALPKEYDDYLRKNSKQITEKAVQIFDKYAVKGSRCKGSELLIYFDNLPKDLAGKAAEDLFDLITESLP